MNVEATMQDSRPENVRERLRTPRAAAVAGIVFAVLFATVVVLIRLAVPEDLNGPEAAAWVQGRTGQITFALTLVPFAGIAFLWFMGVVRARLGEHEDQFFATVFFGSGLLFLAMIFASAAIAGGILSSYALASEVLIQSGVITFGRAVMYTITNVYAIRMAGVFMFSLASVWLRTLVMPRAIVWLTYGLALLLLFASNFSLWLVLIFPLWVLLISVYILIVTFRAPQRAPLQNVNGRTTREP